MDIFLVLLLLTESVLGDKLNRGYLPPPGAHLSAGDLNHGDLPFELPNHFARTEPNSTPNEEMGNYLISSPGSEPPVSYEYNSQTSTTPASATNSISEYFSTPSAQVSTVPELISVTTESNLPQVTDKSQRFNGPFSFGRVNNFTRSGEVMPGTVIEEIPARFKNIHSTFPILSQSDLEPNMFEKEIPKMEYNYPYMKSGEEVEIFDNQQKHDKYSPHIYEPNLPSAGKIESHNNDGNAVITNQNNNLGFDGFSYSFDTSNGMHTDVVGTANDGMKSKGSFSYTGDDGKLYKMEYTADENGFQPIGAHLPTPPPIPEEIKKVIEQAYRNKAAGIVDDGSYNEEKYGYRNYMPRNKEMKQNKDIITKKTMVQPSNIFNDNYSNNIDKSSTTNMPVNNEIIPVQVIYDHGYTYNRPQNMLPVSYQTEYSTSESPKLPIVNIKSIVIDGDNTYNNSPNNASNNIEKSNIFEPSDEVRINENKPFSPSVNNRKSENYKTTTFPTTYINFNNLSDDPSRVTNSQTETTNFPTTATPNYYRNANTEGTYKSRYMPVDNEVISTANPITTASPRVKSMPVYIQTQVRGEDFSGPKQLPAYNPKSGYYY